MLYAVKKRLEIHAKYGLQTEFILNTNNLYLKYFSLQREIHHATMESYLLGS